jgi:hypothetical protein
MNGAANPDPLKNPLPGAVPPAAPDEIDLTRQDPPAGSGAGGAPPPDPSLKDYNPEQDREQMRGTIARMLLWLLIAVIVLSFAVLACSDDKRWVYLKEFLTIVFGPLTTLIGAVTGFYYGSVQKQAGKG